MPVTDRWKTRANVGGLWLCLLFGLVTPGIAAAQTDDASIARYCEFVTDARDQSACESRLRTRLNRVRNSMPRILNDYTFLTETSADIGFYRLAGQRVWVAIWWKEEGGDGKKLSLTLVQPDCSEWTVTMYSAYHYAADGTEISSHPNSEPATFSAPPRTLYGDVLELTCRNSEGGPPPEYEVHELIPHFLPFQTMADVLLCPSGPTRNWSSVQRCSEKPVEPLLQIIEALNEHVAAQREGTNEREVDGADHD